MTTPPEVFAALSSGSSYSFRDKLHATIPLACIGLYTIWRETAFMYVGIAGRGLDLSVAQKRMKGVRDRLDSHRSGRRSGDQFAIYVCDRLVLPTLATSDIAQIAKGELSLDALTRVYIHNHLSYRFTSVDSYKLARQIEGEFARGETKLGKPLLNPATARSVRKR